MPWLHLELHYSNFNYSSYFPVCVKILCRILKIQYSQAMSLIVEYPVPIAAKIEQPKLFNQLDDDDNKGNIICADCLPEAELIRVVYFRFRDENRKKIFIYMTHSIGRVITE